MLKLIFNLPDRNYQFWKDFTYKGQVFNFDHLKSSRHIFKHPQRNEKYVLYFTFSHHVFTKKKDIPLDSDEFYPFPVTDMRLFDEDRYELSKYLPKIIETLPEQFCYHGGYSRYCSCKIDKSDSETIYYQVVYRAWKERGKMRFHIESAYPLEGKLGKVKKVNFWVICHNLLNGKKLPAPHKKNN
jgi:hypothetical protein